MNKRKVFKKVFWKDWPNKPCTCITKGKFFELEYKYMDIIFKDRFAFPYLTH